MKKVKLDAIRIDGGTQSRVVIDQATVYNYLEHMKEGDEFPRMFAVFDGATYWLVDGFHRYHAYKLLGVKEIDIDYKPGTLEEAQVLSFGVNSKHGKPPTREDKQKAVEAALVHPLTKHKSDNEIAKICGVSRSFVGSVRNPETKKKQKANVEKHYKKKLEEQETCSSTTNQPPSEAPPKAAPEPALQGGDAPDEAELLANQQKHQADLELLGNFLDADDKMAHLYEENKRLNHLVVMKELRIKELMNEKSAAVKMVKDLQKQVDKLKAKK